MGERFEGSPAFWTHTVIHNTDQEQKVTAENTEFAEESLKILSGGIFFAASATFSVKKNSRFIMLNRR
jgi:hypothetical protein